jgi:hypothetical protein
MGRPGLLIPEGARTLTARKKTGPVRHKVLSVQAPNLTCIQFLWSCHSMTRQESAAILVPETLISTSFATTARAAHQATDPL